MVSKSLITSLFHLVVQLQIKVKPILYQIELEALMKKQIKSVVDVNTHLAQEYQRLGMEKLAQQREDKMEQMMIQTK